MTNTSVGRLYAAGVIPGAIMVLLFMATIVLIALVRPNLMGAPEPVAPLRERLGRLVDLLAPLVVFVVVMGSIYTGWATVDRERGARRHGGARRSRGCTATCR